MTHRAGVLILMMLVLSCDDGVVPGPPAELTAKSERSEYVAGETIRISFFNSGVRTFELASCCFTFAYYVDVLDSGTWKEQEARGLPCLLLCPGIQLLVAPQQTTIDSLTLNAPGVYRVRVPYSSPDKSASQEVVTNLFSVQSIR